MTFAFIGKITDFYLSLNYHFLEKNHHIQIFTTVDALLNENFPHGFNALIIDYDAYPSAYNHKLVQFLKIIYPEIPIYILINKTTSNTKALFSLDIINCIEKMLPIEEIISKICAPHPNLLNKAPLYLGTDYLFDIRSSVLHHKQIPVPLTKKEIAFLHLLVKNGVEFTTLTDIEHSLYPNSLKVQDVAVRSLVMRFRKKLKEEIIETYPRYGYRLKLFSKSIEDQRITL